MSEEQPDNNNKETKSVEAGEAKIEFSPSEEATESSKSGKKKTKTVLGKTNLSGDQVKTQTVLWSKRNK